MAFVEFFVRYRTRLSQLAGVFFAGLCAFSGKKLELSFPAAAEAMFAAGCLLAGLGAVGRIWCAQYIAGYKADRLIDKGPYSLCRNPLYFFSFLGAVGVGCCTESATLALGVAAAFALTYPGVILSEEKDLLERFGDDYRRYMAAVPRFIPRLSLFAEPREYVVTPRVFRREVFDAVWFVWLAGLLELLEVLGEAGALPKLFWIY